MPSISIETVGLSILGILISIGLFLVGYRKTIGAKKERIIAANLNVERILIRRIVLESFAPSIVDIGRLIEGKARDYRVKPSDLLSEQQFLNSIYTRIVETDFIPQSKREETLILILPIMEESESRGYDEQKLEHAIANLRTNRRFLRLTPAFALGIVAATIGTLIAAVPQLSTFPTDSAQTIKMVAITMTLSLVAITLAFQLLRLRDVQSEPSISSSSSQLEQSINFERDVAKAISESKLRFVPAGPADRGFDFQITTKGGNKILILTKAWTKYQPMQLVQSISNHLRSAIQQLSATEGIIVTKSSVLPIPMDFIQDKVRVMTLKEFKTYIRKKMV